MAIPDSPNWSALTDIKPYPVPAFVKPAPLLGVSYIALGPLALNDSKGKINTRYWVVSQEAGSVVIRGS
jgi:hypothetical protein